VRNDTKEEKTVWIEHPRRPEWTIREGAAKPEESSESFHRFVVKVAPETTEKLPVKESYPQETTYGITNVTREQLDVFLSQRLLSPEMQAALEKVLSLQGEIGNIDAATARLAAEKTSLFENQSRLRQNLQALRGTSEEASLRSRYIQQMQTEEDRVNAIDREIGTLAARRATVQAELNALVKDLALEYSVR
jgi:predicted  nucleic acid-binding Zn-ribbon protein